ncbi:DUF4215 domain-containing protein [Myxococcota bacterium]
MAGRWVSLLAVLALLVNGPACSQTVGADPVCGDGVVEIPETCDGDCPMSCDDGDPCTSDQLFGDSATCDASCLNEPIDICQDGDGCCVAGCDAIEDDDCSSVCGNGVTEPPESCDGDCPTSCDDGDPCTSDQLLGDTATCDATCLNEPIVACQHGDGCCVAGCNALQDDDCPPVCGNGVTEPPETCDGDCPTSCDDGDPCTTDQLFGDAVTCDASCLNEPIVACQHGDGCCPPGCDALQDDDCPPVCGNGFVEPPEICDGNCPQSCDDGDPCTSDQLLGDAATCDASCLNEPIVACLHGDGCCVAGCNALQDDDCPPVCGNGLVEPPETCDGSCPTSCDDGDGCTVDQLTGDAATCDVVCINNSVACQDGDGCCPGGGLGACNPLNDSDCPPMCGNGLLEGSEACDDGNLADWDGCTACEITEFQVNTFTPGQQDYPRVAMAPDGRFVVVWVGYSNQDGDMTGIFGQLHDASGYAVGGELQVNTYTADDQYAPRVAMAPDGRFVVVWHSRFQDGSLNGVYGQRYDASGIPEGSEFQINSYTLDWQDYPKVAMAPDGRFLVTWSSRPAGVNPGQDGDGSGKFGQIYDASGIPEGGEFQVNTYLLRRQKSVGLGGGEVRLRVRIVSGRDFEQRHGHGGPSLRS